MDTSKKALEIYKPPFKFQYGYIFDSNSKMFSDSGSLDGVDEVINTDGSTALRVRGWGRIQKMENPAELQDAVGEHIAKALTEYWERNL